MSETVATQAPLVDTHCHLVLLADQGLLNAALDGAHAAGVEVIVSVGLNLEDSIRNQALADQHAGVYFSVGWHPHEKAPPDTMQQRELAALLTHPKAVAVGEIGLDQYWRPGYHEAPLDVQQRSLHSMLELADASAKPVLVHDRDAHTEILTALHAHPRVRGVMHCFTGDAAHARRCAEIGFLISFSGIVTFPNAEAIKEAARVVGDDGYVVETDSPFLSPAPHRGRVNLPERVAVTAETVAALRGVGGGVVREQTTGNARALLGIAAQPAGRGGG
jgi:TatD DNase family protein